MGEYRNNVGSFSGLTLTLDGVNASCDESVD